MKHNQYEFSAALWLYPGMAAWHFITVPKEISEDIKSMFGNLARGFGSLKVKATVNSSTWTTSIFPDTKEGSYILPIKKEIRSNENIGKGSEVKLLLEIITDRSN